MSTTEITGPKPCPATSLDVVELQCDLADRLDGLSLHFGHGLWAPLPFDPEMRLIAKALSSIMPASDIRWLILKIAMSDDNAPMWFSERRRCVLEKAFKGLVYR